MITLSWFKLLFVSMCVVSTLVTAQTREHSPIDIPRSYIPLEEIYNQVFKFKAKYPELIKIEKIGVTTTRKLPIYAVKVSSNARRREDKPRILFMGIHHAREPIGANICLALVKELCSKYKKNKRIEDWVNSLEVWFVPVVNPEGYSFIFENNLSFPWWRKNLRDNDGDGKFDPLIDGVDLNRNYDFNWEQGGESTYGSWFFRGAKPFSENETQAIQKLATRENFVIGISYHSYGESILFPWGNYNRAPDIDLIVDIASKMASQIGRESGYGTYSILPLNGRAGQSSVWMYGALGILDYIVEVGTEYFPAEEKVQSIIKENINGAYFLFDRIFSSGIRGHVFDLHSKMPVVAAIRVRHFTASYVNPRKSDSRFGSFQKLLRPGIYTIEIGADGYYPQLFEEIKVKEGQPVYLRVALVRKEGYTN